MTKYSKFKKTCSDTTLQAPEAECTKKINQVNRDKEYVPTSTEPQRCNTVKNIRYVHILLLSFAGVHVGVGVVPKLVLELISSFDILPQKIASILIAGNRDGDTPRFAFALLQTSDKT